MTVWGSLALATTAFNVVVLGVLCVVWVRNHLQFRSAHTLGLATFALLLLAENAVAAYYYAVDPTLSVWFATSVPAVAWRAMLSIHLIEAVALVLLARTTLR